jgi:hypothetical protein
MEQIIITTPEQLENYCFKAFQRYSNFQLPTKEAFPKNISSEEARKIVGEIIGHVISKSKWTKDLMNGKVPTKGKAGKWIICDRAEIVQYAEALIRKPVDVVGDAIQESAKRKRL